jgi:hypothetical protein
VTNTLIDSNAPIPAPGALLEHAPQPTPDLLKAVEQQTGLPIRSAVNRDLRKLFHRLQAANQATLDVAPKRVGHLRVPSQSLLQLVQTWRGSCSLAVEVMGGLEHNCHQADEEAWISLAWPQLRSLLVGASAGGYSCVAEDGSIAMPDWTCRAAAAERPAPRRLALRTPAVLVRGEKELSVLLRKVTGLGLTLEGVSGAYSGEEVVIRLDGGESLAGMISWCKDGKAGVELAKPRP